MPYRFNPFTGTLDLVNFGGGLGSGLVVVQHRNGKCTTFNASADTDIARGNAIVAAFASLVDYDAIYTPAATFNIGNNILTGGVSHFSIHGTGKYQTAIIGDNTKVLQVTQDNSFVENLQVSASGTALTPEVEPFLYIYGTTTGHCVVSKCRFIGNTDAFTTAMNDGMTCDVYDTSVESQIDAFFFTGDPLNPGANITINLYDCRSTSNGSTSTDAHTIQATNCTVNVFGGLYTARNGSNETFGVYAHNGGKINLYGPVITTSGASVMYDLKQTDTGVITVSANTRYDINKTSGTINYSDSDTIVKSIGATTIPFLIPTSLDVETVNGQSFRINDSVGVQWNDGGNGLPFSLNSTGVTFSIDGASGNLVTNARTVIGGTTPYDNGQGTAARLTVFQDIVGSVNGLPATFSVGQGGDSPHSTEGVLELDVTSNGMFGGNISVATFNDFGGGDPFVIVSSFSGGTPQSPGTRLSAMIFGARGSTGTAFFQGPTGLTIERFGGQLGTINAGQLSIDSSNQPTSGGTGTVAYNGAGPFGTGTLLGSGTVFTSELNVGTFILDPDVGENSLVLSIPDDTDIINDNGMPDSVGENFQYIQPTVMMKDYWGNRVAGVFPGSGDPGSGFKGMFGLDWVTPMGGYNAKVGFILFGEFGLVRFGKALPTAGVARLFQFTDIYDTVEYGTFNVDPSGNFIIGTQSQTHFFISYAPSGTNINKFDFDTANARLGVGVIGPTASLHLKAGGTAAGSAPIKFTSASLMTSPEAGAVEFLTDKEYLTITTGTARKEFTLNDSALTSGKIPVATTNGRLTDSSSSTLVAAGVVAVVDVVQLTAQGADIGSTNLTNSNVAGLYRVSYALEDTTADITAGAVSVSITYTDTAGSATQTSATQVLTGTGRTQGTIFVQLASGSIAYSTSHTGLFGTAKYALYITSERLK